MTEQTPPDWVLRAASKRCDWAYSDLLNLRHQYADDLPYAVICDLIFKHEQPPADRKLLCAREASAHLDESHEKVFWRSGEGDDCLECCLASLELYERGFGT